MLIDLLAVIPQTRSMVLITYRPEYRGALAQFPGAHTIALAPLTDSQTSTVLVELLGDDPSVRGVTALIASQVAGNPFFAQQMVRDLADRGVLEGERGSYVCRTEVADVAVPATLQAVIAARIDRLQPAGKRTLNAASLIGSRFTTELFPHLGLDPVFDELIKAELIDQVKFTPRAEYVFRHPLIRTVAYASQLKADRAELHRRLAVAIETQGSPDEDAALIAEHREAAGDLQVAYAWRMRAAAWSTSRDIAAAVLSWQRAGQIADSLPADHPDRLALRIAARTRLCSYGWQVRDWSSGARFEELQQLCTEAGDKASLAIGMAGLVMEFVFRARAREASRLASEYMAVLESIGDSTLTIGLSFAAILAKAEAGEIADALRWAQTVLELASGDPAEANFAVGSPLAGTLVLRGLLRSWVGLPGWREDFDRAVAIARGTDPASYAFVINSKYGPPITNGVLLAQDCALREIEDALRTAERSADDIALGNARLVYGFALVHRDAADRERGVEILALLARVHGDDVAYRELKERYRDTAISLGFEGHMAWAEAM